MTTLKVIGFGILGIVIVYVLWIAFVPMLVGQKIVERKVLENSPQYVITQRSAIVELYPQYIKADGGVQIAIKTQMCEIAHNIPQSEWPSEILNICR
jgi:hypothetical protein